MPREALSQGWGFIPNPLVKTLIDCFPEPVFILNQKRMIVFANDRLGDLLKKPPKSLLGLRVGEALGCIHAFEGSDRCGTSIYCRLCGADKALTNSWSLNRQDIQELRLTYAGEDRIPLSIDLRVWATPLQMGDQALTFFALRDTTDENRRQVFERMFFHDILNTAGGLQTVLEIWPQLDVHEALTMSQVVRDLSAQLVEEINIQKDLVLAERGELKVEFRDLDARGLLERVCLLYRRHTIAQDKVIAPPAISGPTLIRSDEVILFRLLGNLIKNALEATESGKTVTVSFQNNGNPMFLVHNETSMNEDVKLQVFQRFFSTKSARGRGLGTYSVKLLTERYLGGKVHFTSSPGEGTTFAIELPPAGTVV